jgi:hypothetical protein
MYMLFFIPRIDPIDPKGMTKLLIWIRQRERRISSTSKPGGHFLSQQLVEMRCFFTILKIKYHPDPLYFRMPGTRKRLTRLDSHVEYMFDVSSKLQLPKRDLALKRSFYHDSRLLQDSLGPLLKTLLGSYFNLSCASLTKLTPKTCIPLSPRPVEVSTLSTTG